jgi:hypothetical protein
METYFSETSVDIQLTIGRYIPENKALHGGEIISD